MSIREKILGNEWGDYFLTAGARLGVLGFSFIANVILTRTIGPEGRGLYALVINSILWATLLASIGASEAVAYFVAKDRDSRRLTAGAGLVIVTIGTVIILAAGIALRRQLPGVLGGISPTALAIILACVLPATFARVFRATLQGLKDFVSYNVCMVARPVSILIYCALFFLALRKGMPAVPYVLLLVTLTECAVNASLSLRHFLPAMRISSDRMRGILSYGARANVTVVLHFIYLRIGIFLLGYLMTKEAVGIYSISASLAEIQIYVPLAVGWVWMPRVATQSLGDSVKGTRMLIRRVVPILLLVSALLAIFGERFLPMVFGSEFAASYVPMLFMLPGGILLGIVLVISGFFDGRGKPHLSAFLSLCAVVVIVIADLVLIPRWGINGAAFGSSLGYLCAFVLAVVRFLVTSREPDRVS
jgi:O-antigen/teichoic acid export membrane protein